MNAMGEIWSCTPFWDTLLAKKNKKIYGSF